MTDFIADLAAATIAGDDLRSVALAQEAMQAGVDPLEAIQGGLVRGMHVIGDKFAKLECFLPEVMLAAEAMTAAMNVIKPHLLESGAQTSLGTIVIATIQGDLHDLGKNIVKIMLEVSGFSVHDLGADVPVRQLVDKAEEVGADIIAASAILTTTMAHMPDIHGILTELGLRDKYMILLGGAPVIADWAYQVGADAYGEDATQAVAAARELMERKQKGGAS